VTLLQKSGEAGIGHFLYTSSTAAFGGFKPIMTEDMKSDPVDWYCATKSASECYAIAASYKYPMRVNIIRPGYTFGVPVAPGAPMGPDGFIKIVESVKKAEDITTRIGDGTQFIDADDLAKLYRAVLRSDVNRQLYHGLSQPWVSWKEVAELAIEKTGSSSKIIVEENPGRENPDLFDLSKIETHFGLHYEPWPRIVELVEYLVKMP
jgi:UDP-glucose 4-epimerase